MSIDHVIAIKGKNIAINYSKSAKQQFSRLSSPVYLEMELLFSCMVTKRIVQVSEKHCSLQVQLNNSVFLSFRPIRTNVCAPNDVDIYEHDAVEIIDIEEPERFIPDWLYIDYSNNIWGGEFGYSRKSKKF